MIVFPLPSSAALVMTGADRARFLQGQLTQDTAAITPEGVAFGALLSPPGRVLAVAHLIERDESIVLIVPAELAAGLAERLRRYVLRAKVSVALPGEALALAGVLDCPPESAHRRLGDGTSFIGLGGRALLLAPAATLAAHVTGGAAAAAKSAWELAAIRAGTPTVGAATQERWTAQMLNLDLLEAISFSKGCYTGQEIVARTQHLGRIKRRMFRYVASAAEVPAAGDALLLDAAKVGEVVRAAAAPGGSELLAVVGLEARERVLSTASGVEFAPATLPYAIA
jgi:folate-binding protein YgfZ